MIVRFTGASLGLMAFTVSSITGLVVGNPIEVTLSRSIFALFVFFLLGLLLGMAAQAVINEYERQGEEKINKRYSSKPIGADAAGAAAGSPVADELVNGMQASG